MVSETAPEDGKMMDPNSDKKGTTGDLADQSRGENMKKSPLEKEEQKDNKRKEGIKS